MCQALPAATNRTRADRPHTVITVVGIGADGGLTDYGLLPRCRKAPAAGGRRPVTPVNQWEPRLS
jgi:hypothetical protein